MSKSGSNGRAARSRGLHDQRQRADERGDPIPGEDQVLTCSGMGISPDGDFLP